MRHFNDRRPYHLYKKQASFAEPQSIRIPEKPIKPELSSYSLSSNDVYEFEHNPKELERRKEASIGCLPLIIAECVVLFLLYAYVSTNKFVLMIAGAALWVMWGVINHCLDKKGDTAYRYERYKNDLKQYEDALAEYNLAIQKKQEEENKKKEHQKLVQEFISGKKGRLLLRQIIDSLSATDVYKYRSAKEWMSLSAREFEIEVGAVYRKLGFSVKVTRQSSDGGVDIVLTKDNKKTFVQCKHYAQDNPVGVRELREFYGVCRQHEVTGEFVYTSVLTKDAQKYSEEIAVSKIMKMVPLHTLIQYDMKGAELLENGSLNYLFPPFVDCRYYCLYLGLFVNVARAQQIISEATHNQGEHYAIMPYFSEELGDTLYVIIVGREEAIRQLEKRRKLLFISPPLPLQIIA